MGYRSNILSHEPTVIFYKVFGTETSIKSVFRVSKKDITRFSFECNDYCGEWITNRRRRRARKNGKKKASFRIVGGRRVIHPRPWMALIEMTSNQGNILFCFISCLIEKTYLIIFYLFDGLNII